MKRIVEVRLNGATAYEMPDETFEYLQRLLVYFPRKGGARMPQIIAGLTPKFSKNIKVIKDYKVRGSHSHSIIVDEMVEKK